MWNQEITEWLLSQGFHQSTADTTYFVKHYEDGSWTRLILYCDDLLHLHSNTQTEERFKKAISGRFRIQFNGDAHWFLQMRIHRYADFSYSIDQSRVQLHNTNSTEHK